MKFTRLLYAVFALSCALSAGAQSAQPLLQPRQVFLNSSGAPCAGCSLYSYAAGTTTPQATYTDASGTTQNTNPVILDTSGSAAIWVGGGSYKFVLKDTNGTTIWTVDQVTSIKGINSLNPSFTGTLSGPNISAGAINQTYVVDGVHYATVAAAMAALQAASPTGGDVWIPCGTYAGPPASSFFTGVHLRSSCAAQPASALAVFGALPYSSSNSTILTYSSGLTISEVGNIGLQNLTFQFTGGASTGNLVLNAVSTSTTENLTVICNDASSNCLTVQGNPTGSYNSVNIHFLGMTTTVGGYYALYLTGYGSSSPISFATDLDFSYLVMYSPTRGGIMFNQWCDSNVIENAILMKNLANVDGVTFNGASTSANKGVYDEKVSFYDENYFVSTVRDASHYAVIFNPTETSNFIQTGTMQLNTSNVGASINDSNQHIWIDEHNSQNVGVNGSALYPYLYAKNYAGPGNSIAVFGTGLDSQSISTFENTGGGATAYFKPSDDLSTSANLYGVNHANSATTWKIFDDGSSYWPTLTSGQSATFKTIGAGTPTWISVPADDLSSTTMIWGLNHAQSAQTFKIFSDGSSFWPALTTPGLTSTNSSIFTAGAVGTPAFYVIPADDLATTVAAYGTNHANTAHTWKIFSDGSSSWPYLAIAGNTVLPNTLTGYHGTSGTKVQLSDGTGASGNCAKFAADGSITDAGAACGSGGGSGTVTTSGTPTNGYLTMFTSSTAIGNSHIDDGVTTAGTITFGEPVAMGGSSHGVTIPAGTQVSGAAGKVIFGSDATNGYAEANENNTGYARICTASNGVCSGSGTVTDGSGVTTANEIAVSTTTAHLLAYATTIPASTLPTGVLSCTEVWSGSGTSSALTSGDDAISNNTCYNDSGSTRTITAVKCRSSAASNTTTVNPTFGSAGTGTTILSGALTCGSSYAYSSSGTVSNASWTTGTGIDPGMGGTLTGTSIAVIVEYHY